MTWTYVSRACSFQGGFGIQQRTLSCVLFVMGRSETFLKTWRLYHSSCRRVCLSALYSMSCVDLQCYWVVRRTAWQVATLFPVMGSKGQCEHNGCCFCYPLLLLQADPARRPSLSVVVSSSRWVRLRQEIHDGKISGPRQNTYTLLLRGPGPCVAPVVPSCATSIGGETSNILRSTSGMHKRHS